MDKYEYRVKTEQMLANMEKKQYKKAMEIADTIDWRRVKSASMLTTVSEIYENNGEFTKSRDTLLIAFDRAPSSRKIIYRLATLALKLNDLSEASDCYDEFVKAAPKDPNQYILKYRILKAQGADISEQIEALEEFKKAEYIEKWAYELAKLYEAAGMTAKCLEECDDLILWFSEGKYVYQAMELKMKYKPLTPFQKQKYDEYKGEKKTVIRRPQQMASKGLEQAKAVSMNTVSLPQTKIREMDEKKEVETSDETRRFPTEELGRALEEMDGKAVEEMTEITPEPVEPTEPIVEEPEKPEKELDLIISESNATIDELDKFTEEPEEEEVIPEAEPEVTVSEEERAAAAEEHRKSITTVVKGATLREALENGVALASGINLEEKRKMQEREEELRKAGQIRIEDILQEWEEKQKINAEAIEKQKAADEERLRKEREALELRREAERAEAEKREKEEIERRKAEEAAKLEAEEAARREAEDAAKREEEEAARRAAEEEARKKSLLSDDIRQLVEELEGRVADQKDDEDDFDIEEELILAKAEGGDFDDHHDLEEEPEENFEEVEEPVEEEIEEVEEPIEEDFEEAEEVVEEDFEEAEEPAEEDFEEAEEPAEEDFEEAEEVVEEEIEEAEEPVEEEIEEVEEPVEEEIEEAEESEAKTAFDELDELDEEDQEDFGNAFDELFDDEEEPESSVEEVNFDEILEDDDYIENESEDDFDEDEFEDEDDFDEDEFEDEDDFDEDEFEDEDDFDEDEFEDEDDFDEDEFEDEDDFDEDDFDEDDFEDEDDFDEDEFEDEDDFDEDEFEDEDDFDEDEFEDDFDEDEFEDEDEFDFDDNLPNIADPETLNTDEPLEIEEPSEEEIQKRIKKSKGIGVPFDTGFVVTGRYDLSATSEIGLKAGLTEEQKKLFSYFVPVRGMSEQIVSVLDNDRRARREGTSNTGNLLIIGRKGSGKTVLAVDIVKAIQKQRNLKQGKVAIVTGESLNKKELTNIIQKLRGGAIIIEKAGKLNSRTIKELNSLMERKTGELLFVLEDQRKPLERIMTANPSFKKKFTSKLELPVFINDELVTFGQTYAKENGYKLDELGILALYSRIDVMQREDHAVTVAEVKEIMDEAISHSQKANVKHLARRVFGKSTDSSDRIILKEEDFRI